MRILYVQTVDPLKECIAFDETIFPNQNWREQDGEQMRNGEWRGLETIVFDIDDSDDGGDGGDSIVSVLHRHQAHVHNILFPPKENIIN